MHKGGGVKKRILCIIILMSLQILDMRDMIVLKHDYFQAFSDIQHTNQPYDSEYDTDFWNGIAKDYSFVWIDDPYRSVGYGLAEWCAKNDMVTNYMVSNRFSDEEIEEGMMFANDVHNAISEGKLDGNAIYITTDMNNALFLQLADVADCVCAGPIYTPYIIIIPKK